MLVAPFLLVGLFLTLPGGCFSRPGFGPAADPLSCRATRKRGKEARPELPTTLRFAAGDLRWAGCGVCRRTHSLRLRRNPFKQLRQARQRSSPVLRQGCHPASRPTQAWAEGGRLGNSQQPTANSQQPAPSLRSASNQGPSEAKALTNSPYVSACGVVVAGLQSCRRTGLLRDLTRCGCLSGARSAKRVPQRTPQLPRRRLPRSEAKGSRTSGSPFLGLPSFGEAKEGRSAAGPRPGLEKQPPGREQNRSLDPSGRLSAHPENYACCTDPSPAATAAADQTPHPPAASRCS